LPVLEPLEGVKRLYSFSSLLRKRVTPMHRG
jgi:hypothetical protein